MSGGDNFDSGGGSGCGSIGGALSHLRCGLLENYLDDDKMGLLMYADNRIEEYIGRKIGRLISRNSLLG